jgi:hypothetical protein
MPGAIPVNATVGGGIENRRHPVFHEKLADVCHCLIESIAFLFAIDRVRRENFSQFIGLKHGNVYPEGI